MGTRTVFLEELENLNNDVIKMGTMLETSIALMIRAMESRSMSMAENVIMRDDQIDDMQLSIEQECILLIAKQQPIATDLREVTSIMKLVTDVERIADHCSDISEYLLDLFKKPQIGEPKDLQKMIESMREMTTNIIISYVNRDVDLAQKVHDQDDIVDQYFNSIRAELTKTMQEKPAFIPQCVDYLMIIKYLERMADHSANIARWIQFIVTGELEQ